MAEPMPQEIYEYAHALRQLHQRGVNIIPLAPQSKKPLAPWSHWTRSPQSWDDVLALFPSKAEAVNIAAVTGAHSAAVDDDWGYLAVIDCDSAESFKAAQALIKRAIGGETLISRTARGGHIWLRTPWPLESARWEGGEIRAYRAYVVAPPSTHPSGIPYRWVNPDAPIVRCDAPLPNIPWQYAVLSKLPRLAAAIMRADERILKRYPTRSEIDWALILSLTNAGASFERVRACYIASRHPKHLDPSRRDFERRLMAEYLRAKEQGNSADYTQAREMAERVKAWALSAEFVGTSPRTRETDRRVLVAHCDRAIKAGKSEWHLSLRDVVQAAQVTLMTASKATKRLINAGLLERKRKFIGECAQTYVWGKRMPKVEHLLTTGGSVSKCSTLGKQPDYAAHPAFEHTGRGGKPRDQKRKPRGPGRYAGRIFQALAELGEANARQVAERSKPRGLGRYAGRIFQALAELGEANERQVAERAGYTRRTAIRHLSAMLNLQLVGHDRSRGVWWACPERLDDVARYLETQDIPAERRARIARERAAYRGWLARCRSDRAGGVNPSSAH